MSEERTGAVRYCATCFYWVNNKRSLGQCRRMPPQIVVTQLSSQALVSSKSPETFGNYWCGEWKPSED